MDRLAVARKALVDAETRAGLRVVRGGEGQSVAADSYAVPRHLANLFPQGLQRGMTMTVSGSPVFALLLAGCASAAGAWVSFLGCKGIGWSCAEASGVDISRCVDVPVIDQQPAKVVSAALQGFDVVVLGDIPLDAREQRILERKAVAGNALLLATGRWWTPAARAHCELSRIHGLAEGHIRGIEYRMRSQYGTSSLVLTDNGWKAAITV